MTPSSWSFDDLIPLGALWMFGGVVVASVVGLITGRVRRHAETGIGIGVLLWGAGNLLVVVAVAALVHVDSVATQLPIVACEPLPPSSKGKPYRRLTVRLSDATGTRDLALAMDAGLCPEEPALAMPVLLRKDALPAGRPLVGSKHDPEQVQVVMVVWGVFGAVGTLLGLGLLAATGRGRAQAAAAQAGQAGQAAKAAKSGKAAKTGKAQARANNPGKRPAGAPAPAALVGWRHELGQMMAWLGLALIVAAFVGPAVMDGSVERSLSFAFRSAGAAMLCWMLGAAARRELRAGSTLGWLVAAGVLFGLAELLRLFT